LLAKQDILQLHIKNSHGIKVFHVDKNKIYAKKLFLFQIFVNFFVAYEVEFGAYCGITFALGHKLK